MTLREKLAIDHPQVAAFETRFGCIGCPREYGYVSEDDSFCDNNLDMKLSARCRKCWDREYSSPEEPRILDSGDRTEFPTGAVRDMREGKGRCDLLPLDVVRDYLKNDVIGYIFNFQKNGNTGELMKALESFVASYYGSDFAMLLNVAKHYEEGAKKYGDNNWRKGIPVRFYIDSAVRHYLKFLRDDHDEPHDRAFCWNILCAIWTCRHKPELNDYDISSRTKNTVDLEANVKQQKLKATEAAHENSFYKCIEKIEQTWTISDPANPTCR